MSKENLFEPGKIRTYTGKYVDPFDMKLDDIDINDIAAALSKQPRFAGHTKHFYSVAEHSLFCAHMVATEHSLAALLHDASEAYLLDIPTPVKNNLPGYREAEHRVMELVAEKFGFQWPLHPEVKEADRLALHWEWDVLVLEGRDISSYSPPQAAFEMTDMFANIVLHRGIELPKYHRNSN